MSFAVSSLIYSRLGQEEFLDKVRFKDEVTGSEFIAEAKDVPDSDYLDVGSEGAYRVSLFEQDPEDEPRSLIDYAP